MIWPGLAHRQHQGMRGEDVEPTKQHPSQIAPTSWTVVPCCTEEHDWWVVSPHHYFASTWQTEGEAQAEAERCNRLRLSGYAASS